MITLPLFPGIAFFQVFEIGELELKDQLTEASSMLSNSAGVGYEMDSMFVLYRVVRVILLCAGMD